MVPSCGVRSKASKRHERSMDCEPVVVTIAQPWDNGKNAMSMSYELLNQNLQIQTPYSLSLPVVLFSLLPHRRR